MEITRSEIVIKLTPEETVQLRKDIESLKNYITDLEEALEVKEDPVFFNNTPKLKQLATHLGVNFKYPF